VYSTCLFCHADLGANEVIEHFPVGRRLAFDTAKGRLWVVCRKCERWNLSPLDERWEAVEECERAFSSTRLRVSSDNVGMARLREGLELVRIGKPQRPEFAAWRYGDQFGRRRRRNLLFMGGGVTVATAAFVSGPVLGLGIAGALSAVNAVANLGVMYQAHRVQARVPIPGKDKPAVIRRSDFSKIAVVRAGDRWSLRLRYDRGILIDRDVDREVVIEGDHAMRAAATILAARNHEGAGKKDLAEALDLIEQAPTMDRLFLDAAATVWRVDAARNRWAAKTLSEGEDSAVALTALSKPRLFALEIAANEDIERRAMEGELAELELAWRQAEEIAAIADDLELPEGVRRDQDKLLDQSRRSDAG
jgi:hypothetical protein